MLTALFTPRPETTVSVVYFPPLPGTSRKILPQT
jgi:hypothetical protein